MEPITWLALGYQVPAKPSRSRVYVWRKLKEYGAVYFRPGVALLPKNKRSLRYFTTLAQEIEEMGGESTLAELRYMDKAEEQRTVSEFISRSTEEFQSLISEISTLRKKPMETRDARRLARQYRQVQSRDYFMSQKLPEVSRALGDLFTDMSHATDDLSKHLMQLIKDRDKFK